MVKGTARESSMLLPSVQLTGRQTPLYQLQ
jgi:hypothetical protein